VINEGSRSLFFTKKNWADLGLLHLLVIVCLQLHQGGKDVLVLVAILVPAERWVLEPPPKLKLKKNLLPLCGEKGEELLL
jgi:hypothetical protein